MSYAANSKAPKGDPIDEPTGAVASDSLAAESINAGGEFANNSNPQVLGVKGANSTLNNSDTSNARVLHAAGNREERDIGENVSQTQYPSQAGGQPNFGGTASQEGYAGGPGAATSGTGTATSHTYSHPSSTNTSTSTGTGAASRPYVDKAPNYAAAAEGNFIPESDLKPKGDNLKENQDIYPNKVTFTGDVGGPKDPGRLAEQGFTQMDQGSDIAAGAQRDNKGSVDDENPYDALRSSERA